MTALRARFNLSNTMIAVITRSFVSGMEQSMIGVVFQPFVLSLGATMAQLGLLNSLGGFGGLIPTLIYPWGGWIADRRGRKIVLLAASAAAMGAFALFAISGALASLAFVFPAIILLGISQVYQPVNTALVGEAVGAGRRGSAYSLIQVVVIVPGIVVPIVAGVVADHYGYAIVFPAAILFELVAFVVIFRFLHETRQPEHEQGGYRAIVKFMQRAWVPPHEIRWFFWAIALDMFAWGLGYGLFYGLLTKEYGFTTTQLGILSAVSSLTWAVTSLPIGRLIDRVGTRPILIFSESLTLPVMLIWMTQSNFYVLAASMSLFAITAATWIPARNVYVTQTIVPARRAEIFGRLSAFSGLVAFPASYIGGFLYDSFGFYAPFLANLIFGMITVAVLVFFVPAPHQATPALANAAE